MDRNDITPADKVAAKAVTVARATARASLSGYWVLTPGAYWLLWIAVAVALVSNVGLWVYVLR